MWEFKKRFLVGWISCDPGQKAVNLSFFRKKASLVGKFRFLAPNGLSRV